MTDSISCLHLTQRHVFMIPNRAHLKFSKYAGDPIISALIDHVVSSKISMFEAKSMFDLVNISVQS